MEITLTISDELAEGLACASEDPARIALEALAARTYEAGIFSVEQVRSSLNLPSRWDAQNVLSRYRVWPGTTGDDLEEGLRHLDTFLAAANPAES